MLPRAFVNLRGRPAKHAKMEQCTAAVGTLLPYLPRISPMSPLYLPDINPISPLYLPYTSQVGTLLLEFGVLSRLSGQARPDPNPHPKA